MNIFKSILFYFLNILTIPLTIVCSFGITWYLLPAMQKMFIGKWVLSTFSAQAIFWMVLGSAIALFIFIVLDLIFNWEWRSRAKNFFTHTRSWLLCVTSIGLAILTFAIVTPLTTEGITIGPAKKISILSVLALLVVFHVFSGKVSKLVNRRIQAYDNAKELGVVGRSSVVYVNFLRLLEILLPEILILILLCLMLSWDVSGYFVIILVGMLSPVFGNIVCDLRVRKEVTRDNRRKERKLINNISDKINEGE